MQCKCTFTQRFALSTPQRKCLLLRQQSQKSRFVGAAILLYHSRFFSHCAVQNYEAYRYQQSLSRSMPKMSAFNSHMWFCYSCGYHKICCHHVISERWSNCVPWFGLLNFGGSVQCNLTQTCMLVYRLYLSDEDDSVCLYK